MSPVIAAFLRNWNDSVDDGFRQRLKPYTPNQPKAPKPCIRCGVPTMRVIWTALWWTEKRSTFDVEWTPYCEACKVLRIAEQEQAFEAKRATRESEAA